MKHTPGNWMLDPGAIDGCKNIGTMVDGRFESLVCTDGLNSEKEDLANARLIAAAPEFLDLVKIGLSSPVCPFCGRENQGYDRCSSDDCPGVQCVAKATGN